MWRIRKEQGRDWGIDNSRNFWRVVNENKILCSLGNKKRREKLIVLIGIFHRCF